MRRPRSRRDPSSACRRPKMVKSLLACLLVRPTWRRDSIVGRPTIEARREIEQVSISYMTFFKADNVSNECGK